jgi:hypothetical protein
MLQEIAERLKASCPSLKNRVEGADDYDSALENNKFPAPCAYVVELEDSGEPNTMTGVHRQRITTQIGVMMVVSNKRDATGSAAHSNLTIIREEVRAALAGWSPTDAEPMNFLKGRSVKPYGANRFWASVFTTKYQYRNA